MCCAHNQHGFMTYSFNEIAWKADSVGAARYVQQHEPCFNWTKAAGSSCNMRFNSSDRISGCVLVSKYMQNVGTVGRVTTQQDG